MSWESPKIEMLIDFLSFHQNWEPSFIRQKLLSMLSTIYLRVKATDRGEALLHNQYEFDSIQRMKMRYGRQLFVVKWRKVTNDVAGSDINRVPTEQTDLEPRGSDEVEESVDLLDEADAPLIHVDDGNWFLLTDEDMGLVRAAFPEEVDRFLREKVLTPLFPSLCCCPCFTMPPNTFFVWSNAVKGVETVEIEEKIRCHNRRDRSGITKAKRCPTKRH